MTSLTTLATQIIVHIWTGVKVFHSYFIFSLAPNMNQHHIHAHTISSNEICTNKGADTAVHLIMNTMDYCDTPQTMIYRPEIQRRVVSDCLYSFCFKDILIFICLCKCVVGLCFIGCVLPFSHPLHSHFSTVLHANSGDFFRSKV